MSRFHQRGSLSWTCAVPVLCAVHCAAAPLLVGLLPALALSDTMEWLLMGASLILAVVVGWSGFRIHRQWLIPAALASGLVVWALSLAGAFEPIPEVATTTVGALVVAGGLFWNARLRMYLRGRECGCPACDGAEDEPHPEAGTGPKGRTARPQESASPTSA